MIISPGRGYIFVHIPKTGGTSLSLALERRAKADDILIGDTPKALRRKGRLKGLQHSAAGRLWKHSRLADIEGVVDLDGKFIVTFVRNPWDRMVSYYHWLKVQRWEHPAVSRAKSLPFGEFIRDPDVAASVRVHPYPSYVRDGAGHERCDLFVRLEKLDEDILPFETHLGFRLTPLDRVNASDRDPDYRTHYDDSTAELVSEMCAADIVRFGYEF